MNSPFYTKNNGSCPGNHQIAIPRQAAKSTHGDSLFHVMQKAEP